MIKKKFDPFENLVLDKYEHEIEDALEKGEFVSDPHFKKNKILFEKMAKEFLETEGSKSITLRVKKRDLIKVKAKAKESRIPYQRLINLLISNYVGGKIKIAI